MAYKYKYRFRPGYGSDKLLIEFTSGVENKSFVHDLFDTIKELNPKIHDLQDLWMNDEVLYSVNSDLGQFILSKDIWNLAFIMSDDNQVCVTQINNLLIKDNRFEKVEVDFSDYKNASS